ncbi:MAG: hypothetical protein ABFC90_01045 [Bacteroidales bacterium]|nr:hypothetical protein [Bacteroidales bacterium]
MDKYIKPLIFLLLISFSSCKEEENNESVSYPIIYTNVPVTENCFKVFTKNGEITDFITINNLINKYADFLVGMNKYNLEGKVTLTYLSSESVELYMLDSDNTDTLAVHNKPELIYWEEKDTTCQPIGTNLDDRFFMYKYKPLYYEEFAIPLSSGYTTAVRYKQCYYAKRDEENFILPMLDFLYKHDNLFCTYGIAINNVFSRKSISNFGTNDTLIINEYSLKLKR